MRPLRDMTGGSSFCEIFFDDVRVPVANLVGDENDGWRIARTSMGHERSTAGVSQAMRYRRIVDELYDLARDCGRNTDPVIRQRLAAIEIDVRLIELNNLRTLASVVDGAEPGPVSSIGRLMFTEFEKRLHDLAVDITGPRDDARPERSRDRCSVADGSPDSSRPGPRPSALEPPRYSETPSRSRYLACLATNRTTLGETRDPDQ